MTPPKSRDRRRAGNPAAWCGVLLVCGGANAQSSTAIHAAYRADVTPATTTGLTIGNARVTIHQGLPQANDRSLDRTHTWARTYWGGALYCLVADVGIREQTDNRRPAVRPIASENAASHRSLPGARRACDDVDILILNGTQVARQSAPPQTRRMPVLHVPTLRESAYNTSAETPNSKSLRPTNTQKGR